MDDTGVGYIVISEHRLNAVTNELMNIYSLLEAIRDVGELPKGDTISALKILHEAMYRIYAFMVVQDKYLDFDLRAYDADSKFEQFMKGMLGGSEIII